MSTKKEATRISRNARGKAKTNAILTLLLMLGILVLLNVLGLSTYTRADLTQNGVYTLSEGSIEAVRALDGLEVRVYISDNLPEEIPGPWGQRRSIRGFDRELLDKLEEYRGHSGGRMKIVRVEEDIETKAERAKLELFTAEEAKVETSGELQFTRYAIGATFSYQNVTEVLPFAANPQQFEHEITRILLRLREKYEYGLLMVDPLEAGKALFEAVEGCNAALGKATASEGAEGGELSGDPVQRLIGQLVAEFEAIKEACGPIADKLAETQAKLGARNEDLDRLFGSVAHFVDFYGQMLSSMEDPETQRRAFQIADALQRLFQNIDHDHGLLVDSPGRKTIGFICGHGEFCPFADPEPLVNPQMAQLLGQQNQFVQAFIERAGQLQEEINGINESIRRGVFAQRGFEVKRVGPDEPIPGEIDGLVIWGPSKPLAARTLYEIDQFLLSGRPVLALVGRFDVAVRLRDLKDPEQLATNLYSTESNLHDFLAHYGVTVGANLVMELDRNAPIVLAERVQLGGGGPIIPSEIPFRYPLLPTFTEIDPESPIVGGLTHVTLPYVSTLDAAEAEKAGRDVRYLVRSSTKALALGNDIPLLPPQLNAWMRQQLDEGKGDGPFGVAVSVKGEFTSYFAGKPEPQAPKASAGEEDEDAEQISERRRLDSGLGRLAVFGSALGLPGLSVKGVFEGFDMSQLAGQQFNFIEQWGTYVARFLNWRTRIDQHREALGETLDLLPNLLNWTVQNEVLNTVHAKGLIRRPLDQTTPGEQRLLRYAGLLAGPLLFVLFGIVRWQIRRRRKPRLD